MSTNPFVAIQIGPNSFLEEGTDNVLDILQERGAVNALLLASHSFCYGTAGRAQYRFPDHGAQEPDHMQGGSFIHNRPQYYAKTAIRDFRAPDRDSGGIDIMDEVVPKARSRGDEGLCLDQREPVRSRCEACPRLHSLPGRGHVGAQGLARLLQQPRLRGAAPRRGLSATAAASAADQP